MTSDEASYRYRGFISYSQKDRAKAKRLHRALEAYRVPKRIEAMGLDEKKRTLGRFFRDDDEMGAATDLGAALRGAIADSQNLIVLCSPRAARSRWVNEEILHFKRTGRGASIFAVIIAGTPNSGDPDTECFPAALRFQMGEDGALTDTPAEPLGLDWRKDGYRRLKARLAAGLLGVSFDDLWRRDRRRARGRAGVRGLVTLGVLAVVGAVALLVEDRFRAAEVRTLQNNLVRLGQLALSEGDNRQAIRYGIAALHYGSLDHHQDRGFLHEALTALEPAHVPYSAFVTTPGPLEFDFGILPNGDPHVRFVRVFADDRYVVAVTRRGGNIFDRRLGHSIGIDGVIDRPQDIVEIEGGATIVMVDRPPPDLLSNRVYGDPLPEPPTRAPEYGLAIYDFPSNTRLVTAGGVKAHALSHDGLRIFLSLNTGRSCIFDIATSGELKCLEGAPDNAVRAAISPDDQRLAIVDLSGTITVFDSDDLILTVPRSQAYPHDVEFVGGSDRLLVHDARAVRTEFRVPQCPVAGSTLYAVPGGNALATLNRLCDPAAVSSDQRTLMTPSTFADVGSGAIRTATVFNGADYATSADGTMLAVSIESEIRVYDTQSAG